MTHTVRPILFLLVAIGLATPIAVAQENQDPNERYAPALFQAMQWRNIGPYRGGRVMAATGIPDDPMTYYMGATGGGVWKTGDGGTTWENISDGFFKTGSVGAVAVAPSDPNVIYVGMGSINRPMQVKPGRI